MNILFLDIDGVVIHRGESENLDVGSESVDLLNSLIDEENLNIVVSSTHRLSLSDGEVVRFLQNMGIETPDFVDMTPIIKGKPRGLEILMWLQNNSWDRFVIVDDDPSDIKPLEEFVVVTSMEEGFGEDHYEQVQEILAAQDVSRLPHIQKLWEEWGDGLKGFGT